jgi:D-amino-acid dehydrogenase
MARTDVIVLGAGIVGTSIALHLAKRGLAVALVDRRGPGEETSYGNAGVIEGNTLFPHAFPAGFGELLRIALKRAPEANYHLAFLPRIAPWLLAYRANTTIERRIAFAEAMRPLFERAVGEHEARALEPSLLPVFRHAVHWPDAASVSNPLAVTKAYAAQFVLLGGIMIKGDALTLHRNGANWRVDTDEGPLDAREAVVALGPWAPDLLDMLGIKLPLAVKRGYHWHFRPHGNAGLTRPVVDTENGYCIAPMEQGLRITTGAEFASRDAPPTPVQFDRLLPAAKGLIPLEAPVEAKPWMGSRPCFADSRPVIGRAPNQSGLWLCYGHAHWGLTLGPVTGRLMAEMITGSTLFCDPAPYAAERFARA